MPVIEWPDLIGGSYRSSSEYAAVERCENWYVEAIEVPEEKKTRKVLYPRPATVIYGASPGQCPGRDRGSLAYNSLIYFVHGTTFGVLYQNGVATSLGTVADDGNPAVLSANNPATNNGGQVAVAAGGNLYVYSGGIFAQIPNDGINFLGAV